MNDIKTLKAYANGRQLPSFKLIANIKKEWLEYAHSVYSNTSVSSDYAKFQREKDGILGTMVESYDTLTLYYNQMHPVSLNLSDEYRILDDVYDIRFGKLEPNALIPFHLDEPFSLRSLCVIKGHHLFSSETGEKVVMHPGELYFVNGCYKHSIQNLSNISRVALLTKYPITKDNLNIISQL